MPETHSALPPDVEAALQRGDSIDAIMLLRDATGLGLKEAKDAIDAHLRGRPVLVSSIASETSLPPAVVAALVRGNKLEAIRLLREHAGLGLKEAKDAVEASSAARAQGASSLGEQPRGVNSTWWFVLLIAAVVVVYFVIQGTG